MVIKDEEGRILSEAEEVKKGWRGCFGELLNEENPLEELEDVNLIEWPIVDITKREVKEALKGMKRGKSGGPSKVTTEMLKALGEKGEVYIHRLLELMWAEERIPADWRLSLIIKNRGDALEGKNYRGIKLLEHVMKIMEKILDKRLCKIVEVGDM